MARGDIPISDKRRDGISRTQIGHVINWMGNRMLVHRKELLWCYTTSPSHIPICCMVERRKVLLAATAMSRGRSSIIGIVMGWCPTKVGVHSCFLKYIVREEGEV